MSNRKKRAFFRNLGCAPQVSQKTISLAQRALMRHLIAMGLVGGARRKPRAARRA